MVVERETLRNYLLGRTTEAMNEEIGVRMIEDPSLSTAIAMAENELVEDYIEGSLTGEDVTLFKRNFLVNENRHDLVNEVALLKRYSSGPMPLYDVTPIGGTRGGGRSWRAAAVGFCCLLLVLAGLFAWRAYSGETRTEADYEAINRADLSDPAVAGRYKQITVKPGSVRDANDPVESVPAGSDDVLLRLPLTSGVQDGTLFDAEIINAGGGVFRVTELPVVGPGGLHEVRMVAPGSALTKGTNRISLKRRNSDAAPAVFELEVR